MCVKIRLARGGRKNRPYYHIVVADSRSPRDGKFKECVGSYDPMLASDNEKRFVLKTDRIEYWLSVGAQPTETVSRILLKKNVISHHAFSYAVEKAKPKAKAAARLVALEQKKAQDDGLAV